MGKLRVPYTYPTFSRLYQEFSLVKLKQAVACMSDFYSFVTLLIYVWRVKSQGSVLKPQRKSV